VCRTVCEAALDKPSSHVRNIKQVTADRYQLSQWPVWQESVTKAAGLVSGE